ncbi:hypothetical protein FRX31_024476 [Thalictrum thalictroides]|uniref:Uncharacterized protein n=1 Tax=Thalictrum thalictroides TaxID=46969 RepID=A0A7J6VMF6_THATH|nr:hypothetical protein FRX31_024476 [Thalictrum thalictroides]
MPEWQWILSKFTGGGGLNTKIIQAVITATVYAVWKERNFRVFRGVRVHEKTVIMNMHHEECEDKVSSKSS